MTDLPDELTDLSEEEREQRRQELVEESAETRQRLEAEQEDLLDSLEAEHGGDRIETAVTLPGDNLAHVEVLLNGEFINRMSRIEDAVEGLDDSGAGQMSAVERAMDDAAGVLADIIVEQKYSKDLFYEIYRRYGPEALAEHVEAVFDAIETASRQHAGGVEGFRDE